MHAQEVGGGHGLAWVSVPRDGTRKVPEIPENYLNTRYIALTYDDNISGSFILAEERIKNSPLSCPQ